MEGKDWQALITYLGNTSARSLTNFGALGGLHPFATGFYGLLNFVGRISDTFRCAYVPRLLKAGGAGGFAFLTFLNCLSIGHGDYFKGGANLLLDASMTLQLTMDLFSAYKESNSDLATDIFRLFGYTPKAETLEAKVLTSDEGKKDLSTKVEQADQTKEPSAKKDEKKDVKKRYPLVQVEYVKERKPVNVFRYILNAVNFVRNFISKEEYLLHNQPPKPVVSGKKLREGIEQLEQENPK